MLYETAARASEILALNVEDLDQGHRRAPVRSKFITENNVAVTNLKIASGGAAPTTCCGTRAGSSSSTG
ncbi:hypothetical protein GCM10027187_29640 [Streptosporangium sandarakinum]